MAIPCKLVTALGAFISSLNFFQSDSRGRTPASEALAKLPLPPRQPWLLARAGTWLEENEQEITVLAEIKKLFPCPDNTTPNTSLQIISDQIVDNLNANFDQLINNTDQPPVSYGSELS